MAKHNVSSKIRSGNSSRGRNGARRSDKDRSQFADMIENREIESVFGALAAGFCVGLVLGAALARPNRQESWTDRVTAEGLGRRVIDALDRILPDAITERLHS